MSAVEPFPLALPEPTYLVLVVKAGQKPMRLTCNTVEAALMVASFFRNTKKHGVTVLRNINEAAT